MCGRMEMFLLGAACSNQVTTANCMHAEEMRRRSRKERMLGIYFNHALAQSLLYLCMTLALSLNWERSAV